MNSIVLLGRMTKDAEVRYTSTGKVVASFSLAVDRPYTGEDGKREADFINCVIWGKSAETLGNSVHKGQRVLGEGRLQIRPYTDKNGNQATWYEIAADRLSFTGESRQGNEPPVEHGAPPVPSAPAASADTTAADDDYPF